MLLRDKVALVSGAGPGLGAKIALEMSRHGAKLAIGARSASNLEAVAKPIRAAGGEVLCVSTDIADRAQCERIVERCVETYGRLDCLVNNAATGYEQRAFEDADLDEWRRTMEVNLFGSLQMCQAAVPKLKAQGGGSIVFINSMNIHTIPPRQGGYTTSKGALISAARVLARELGPHGIRVNSVVPGWMWGPSIEKMFTAVEEKTGTTVEKQYERVASAIPLGFVPTDEDCAGAVVFFASDLARVVTGQTLDVNGGEVFR